MDTNFEEYFKEYKQDADKKVRDLTIELIKFIKSTKNDPIIALSALNSAAITVCKNMKVPDELFYAIMDGVKDGWNNSTSFSLKEKEQEEKQQKRTFKKTKHEEKEPV